VARAGRAGIRRRPARALSVFAGIFAAGLSFGLLTSETAGSRLHVTSTVRQNFRSAYDILVRPKGAASSFERTHHLVDDGFLSGQFGGITMNQYREISHIPGVSLAAPVANLGYFMVSTQLFVPFPKRVRRSSASVYRIELNWDVHHGLASYPGATSYVYYTTDGLRYTSPASGLQVAAGGTTSNVCGGFAKGANGVAHTSKGLVVVVVGKAVADPYKQSLAPNFYCSSPNLTYTKAVRPIISSTNAEVGGRLGAELTFQFPVLIAGIDPDAEQRLVGLRSALTAGHYLKEGAGLSKPSPTPGLTDERPLTRFYPVLASTDTFLDEAATIKVRRLNLPKGQRLATILASSSAYAAVTKAQGGRTLWKDTVSPTTAWRALLGNFQHASRLDFTPDYWRVGPAHYRLQPGSQPAVAVKEVPNDPNVWSDTSQTAEVINGAFAPPGSADTWYRQLRAFGASGNAYPRSPRTFLTPAPKLTGTFDPSKLRGFSPLSKVPLQTFYPPQATGANAVTRRRLQNTALGPTTNLGGYLTQPPLLLTTLAGALALDNGEGDSYTARIPGGRIHVQAYAGASPKAPISAIQVRVAGITGPNSLSLAKINLIAEEIARRTGLTVDVTAGSSPTDVGVKLAKGRYGTPALDLQQQWVREDVDSAIIEAQNSKDIALLILITLACGLFVAGTTLAGVRERKREMAILGTLGWPGAAIAHLIVGEAAQVGFVAGLSATGAAYALGAISSLQQPASALVLITPAATLLAIAAAAAPALLATRRPPANGLAGPSMPVGRRHQARSLSGLAFAQLIRVPGRTLLAVTTLAVAVAAAAALVGIEISFRGAIAHDLLGQAVAVYVRGADTVSIVLLVLVGGASVADIVHSGMRERATELATLRATGWTDRDVSKLAAVEGLAIGLCGSVLGAVVGSSTVVLLGASLYAFITTAAIAIVAGTAISMLALAAPLCFRSRPPLLDGLAAGSQ
jgi:putative ABC transport system permease protein